MNDEIRKNLVDILFAAVRPRRNGQSAEEIQDFVRGMDFKAYQNNPVA